MAITKQQVLDMAKTSNNKDTLDVLVQANKDEINEKLLTNLNVTKNQFFAIVNHLSDSWLASFYQSNQGEIRRHISQYNTDLDSKLVSVYVTYFKSEFTSDEINQMLLNLEENCIPIIIENNLEVKMNKSLYIQYILKYLLTNNKYRSSYRYSSSYSKWASNLDHDILDELFKSDNNSFICELLKAIKIKTLSNDELQLLYDKQDADIIEVLAPVIDRITTKSINPNDILKNIKAYINSTREIDIKEEIVNLKTYRNTFDKDFYEELVSILASCKYSYTYTLKQTFFSIIPIDTLLSLSNDVLSMSEYFSSLHWKNMTINDFRKLVNRFPKCASQFYQLYIYNTNNIDQKEMLLNEVLSNENVNVKCDVLYDITPEQLLQFILKDSSYINIISNYYRYRNHPDFLEKDLDILYKNRDKLAKYNNVMLQFIHTMDCTKPLPEIFIEFYNNELEGFSSAGNKQLYSEEREFIDHNLLKLKPKLVGKDLNLDRRAGNVDFTMRIVERTDCPLEILEHLNTCSGVGSNRVKQIIRQHPTYVETHKVEHVEKDDIDDVRDIIRIAISRGTIRQSDKDDLGISRDNDTIRDIWRSLVDQEFISNKQQKYVDLAKLAIQ